MFYERKSIRGFTLIETIVIVLILALILIMAYPALKKIRENKPKVVEAPPAAALT
jgi:Tfp pilus assembly protein PilE